MKRRIDSLQVLRALAFLGIFLQHNDIIDNNTLGGWGVSVFFVLSGFLMFYSYGDKELETGITSCLRFGIQKIRKLYPLHIIVLMAVIAADVIKEIIGGVTETNWWGIIPSIFLVQTWFPFEATIYYYGIAWFLSSILFCYICFPMIRKMILKKDSVLFSIVLSIITFALQCLWVCFSIKFLLHNANVQEWSIYVSPYFRVGDFIVGCSFGHIFGKITIREKKAYMPLTVFCFLIVILQISFRAMNLQSFWGKVFSNTVILYTVTSVTLVWLLARGGDWITKGKTGKIFVMLGNWSAYTYLIHSVVIRYCEVLFQKVLKISISKCVFIIITFSLTLVCTWLYVRLEQTIKNQKMSQRRQVAE